MYPSLIIFKQWAVLLLVSVTSAVHGYLGFVCEEKANKALYGFCRRILPLCSALTTSVFWQSLLSQSRSNCLQPLPHRSWRGELRRILTSLYQCARTRHPDIHTHTRTFTVYPCQVEHCGVAGGASGVQQPNVSSSINGCFSWLKGENTLKNHTSEQPLGSVEGPTDWHSQKPC